MLLDYWKATNLGLDNAGIIGLVYLGKMDYR